MTLRPRAVAVKQLPQKLNAKQARLFFRELESCMNVERPCVVLDCSTLREMDVHAVHLLLCCLEEAMKRNGDVRLAAVAPEAFLNLELSGADRVFKIFDEVEQAVESYQRRGVHVVPRFASIDEGNEASANAA